MPSYLYFAERTGGSDVDMRRVDLSTFTLDASLGTTTASSGLVGAAASGDVVMSVARLSPADIAYKIDAATFTQTASLTLTGTKWHAHSQMVVYDGHVYIAGSTADGVDMEIKVHKVRISDWTLIGTLATGVALSMLQSNNLGDDAVVLDEAGGWLFVAGENLWSEQTDAANYFFKVAKIDLSTFTVDSVRRTDPDQIANSCGFSDGTYVYFGGSYDAARSGFYDPPHSAQIERYKISDGTTSRITLANYDASGANSAWFQSAIIDGATGYFGNASLYDPPRICKVDLSTFTITSTLELNTAGAGVGVRGLAQDATYIYAACDEGTITSTEWSIVRISKATFAVVDSISDASFAYFQAARAFAMTSASAAARRRPLYLICD